MIKTEINQQNATIKNSRRTAFWCSSVVVAMVGLSFASAPLYRLFCQTTGFGGTPMISQTPQIQDPTRQDSTRQDPTKQALNRTMTIRFDANVAPGLKWIFTPETHEIELSVGDIKTVLYTIKNNASHKTTGIASFNVQPSIAGAYFSKIQCFCFTEHTLEPGETMESAVMFYIDPAIADDKMLDGVKSITLSYTYFEAKNPKVAVKAENQTPVEEKPKL